MGSLPLQAVQFSAQNSTFDSGVYVNSSSLNTPPVVPKDEVFVNVSGRLALLNSNIKYDVSVAEVTRRVRAPENLNISLLGAVLRKAKNRDSNKVLVAQLAEKGIHLTSGRRRTLAPNTFTALCEAEAFKLAEDFQNAIKDHLDAGAFLSEVGKAAVDESSPLAAEIRESFNNFKHHTTDDEMADTITYLMILLFRCVAEVLERDQSLLYMGLITPEKFGNRKRLSPEFQHQLKTFNLVTHNFGVKAVQAVFSSLSKTDEPSNSSGECEDSDEND
ncbi:TF-AP-2 domain-containing protein [Aphelenchoides besseyi]|nr:TF-AP-2 domain-containing protein [Aphelenchoides besseyi]